MTVTLFRDEPRRRAFWTLDPVPAEPPKVLIGDVWYPLSMDGPVGAVLLCGPDVVTPPAGAIVVAEDTLPVLDIGGEFYTNDWIRVRSR